MQTSCVWLLGSPVAVSADANIGRGNVPRNSPMPPRTMYGCPPNPAPPAPNPVAASPPPRPGPPPPPPRPPPPPAPPKPPGNGPAALPPSIQVKPMRGLALTSVGNLSVRREKSCSISGLYGGRP